MLDYIYSDAKKPLKMIVWDLGRRCNFDCTYCTGWMHSTTAPFNDFEEYKKLPSLYISTIPYIKNIMQLTGTL